ncbi:hypothetical protein LCGC14_0594910 [marine sediment metagenome]|uniref:Uncharacterized protein n=1 Tax=marine sediment metagenome TaxID=412755 RepID=A0A0F9UKS2_9ZZZZ
MREQNKIVEKKLITEPNQIKLKRQITKHEPIISRILYLVSIGWFIFETFFLSLVKAYGYLLNVGAWIILLIGAGIFIIIPILHYFKIILLCPILFRVLLIYYLL